MAILADNQKLLSIYLGTLSNARTARVYGNLIERLMRAYEDRPITSLQLDDVKVFLDETQTKTDTNYNKNISFLKTFFHYLTSVRHILPFDPSDLDQFRRATTIDNSRTALTLDETILALQYLRQYPRYYYLFSLVSHHGLSLDEMAECRRSRYNYGSATFKLNGAKYIELSSDLASLVGDHPDLLDSPKVSTIQWHFGNMSELLVKNRILNTGFSWQNLYNTFEAISLVCPICGKRYLIQSGYWALVHYEVDTTDAHWLACTKCRQAHTKVLP